jgi:hypothetical protein
MEEVLCHVDELMDFEGNVASGFVFDFAAVGQRVEGVLLAAPAFESVAVVFGNLLLEKHHESVGNRSDEIFVAVQAV